MLLSYVSPIGFVLVSSICMFGGRSCLCLATFFFFFLAFYLIVLKPHFFLSITILELTFPKISFQKKLHPRIDLYSAWDWKIYLKKKKKKIARCISFLVVVGRMYSSWSDSQLVQSLLSSCLLLVLAHVY